MADFLLYVFKLNVLAALLIVLVFGVSKFLSKKYSVWWRSWIWLAVWFSRWMRRLEVRGGLGARFSLFWKGISIYRHGLGFRGFRTIR